MLLASLLDTRNIVFEQRILTKEQVYGQMVDNICRNRHLPVCGKDLLDLILARDREATTAYPSGLAVPHIRMDGFKDTVVGMTFLQNPLDFDGTKVDWVVLIITDKSSSILYLNMVATLLTLSRDADTVKSLHACLDGHSLLQRLKQMGILVKKDLTIADIMVRNPVSVTPDAFLRSLNKIMCDKEVSVVPVTDSDGKYLGEVNILNLLKVGVPNYLMMIDNLNFLLSFEPLEHLFEKLDEVQVREIMVTDEKTLGPQASVIEAVSEMIKHKKRYMSVVEKGNLVGVITAMDIFRKIVKA